MQPCTRLGKKMFRMFSKFTLEKAPKKIYRRGLRKFEAEQPTEILSIPVIDFYDQTIKCKNQNHSHPRGKSSKQVIFNWLREYLLRGITMATYINLKHILELVLYIGKRRRWSLPQHQWTTRIPDINWWHQRCQMKLRFAADGRGTSKRIGTAMAVLNILAEDHHIWVSVHPGLVQW